MASEFAIAQKLLSLISTVRRDDLFPSYYSEASELIATNPFAYALAVSLNRQTKAEIIWTIPYDLQKALGHLDPIRIANMSIEELDRVFQRLPHKPRFYNDAPRTVKELSEMVVRRYYGDAERIWKNRPSTEVILAFKGLYGVGQQIANLVVLLLEYRYGIQFSDLDHRKMDIKADTHTCRVLKRLGVAANESEDEAIAAARRLNPDYPGAIDGVLWVVGRTWCHASSPEMRCVSSMFCV